MVNFILKNFSVTIIFRPDISPVDLLDPCGAILAISRVKLKNWKSESLHDVVVVLVVVVGETVHAEAKRPLCWHAIMTMTKPRVPKKNFMVARPR